MNQRLEKLKQMEAQKPDDPFLKFAIAQEYVGMNDDIRAKQYFELLLQRYPHYLPVYYQFGKLHERFNNIKLATDIYTAGIVIAKAINDLKTAGELNEALMLLEDA